jgi:hypothetical protein
LVRTDVAPDLDPPIKRKRVAETHPTQRRSGTLENGALPTRIAVVAMVDDQPARTRALSVLGAICRRNKT